MSEKVPIQRCSASSRSARAGTVYAWDETAHAKEATWRSPSQAGAYFVIAATGCFGVAYVAYLRTAVESVSLGYVAGALLMFKTAVEVVASSYGFAFLFASAVYLALREREATLPRPLSRYPALGVIYLCCDDVNEPALESLARLDYPGRVHLIVHDDSHSSESRAEVTGAIERLRRESGREILYLRRPSRQGGKPGAVNHVLAETGHLYELFLLCDNDSRVLDRDLVQKALPYFENPSVAVVQCRNVAVDSPTYCPVNRILARSINVFDVFLTTYSRFGWQPFIGHNALLRTRDVLAVGGFTPGYFSDDLDLTVRLNLRGRRVVYASELRMGEQHPPSYASLRKRSYKWAYGCMQTLRAHAWAVLTAPQLTLAEKVSFFQFAGFYVGQTVLLLYLAVVFLVTPFVLVHDVNVVASVISGALIIVLTYLPILAYFAREGAGRGWFRTVILCGLIYGTTDFSCARGVWDCLWRRDRPWTPTNSRSGDHDGLRWLGEAVFGLALLCVPLFAFPGVLYLPCSYLFAGKFLFGPTLALAYDDRFGA